jgi:hypothetical protein
LSDTPFFVDKFYDALKCDGFHGFTTTDPHDGFAVNVCVARDFSNAYFDNSLSDLVAGDHLAVNVFRASEVHHADVVALLPSARRFLANVPVTIRNNVASS